MDRVAAQLEMQWALVTSNVTNARLQAQHLRQLLARVQSLIAESKDKEALYQVAGDLISSVPDTLARLEARLDECQYTLAYQGRKQLRDKVPPEAKARIERVMKAAFIVADQYLQQGSK